MEHGGCSNRLKKWLQCHNAERSIMLKIQFKRSHAAVNVHPGNFGRANEATVLYVCFLPI